MHFEATQVVAGMWVHTVTHSNDISERWGGGLGGGGGSRSACPVGVKTHKILGNGKQQNI